MGYCAIKTPTGKLITSSVSDNRTTCYEEYVAYLLNQGFLPDRPDWHGPDVCRKHWRVLRRKGFSIVQVSVTQCKNNRSGWAWPQLKEITSN